MITKKTSINSTVPLEKTFPLDAIPRPLRGLARALSEEFGISPSIPATIGFTLIATAAGKSVAIARMPEMFRAANFASAWAFEQWRLSDLQRQAGATFMVMIGSDTGPTSHIIDRLFKPICDFQEALFAEFEADFAPAIRRCHESKIRQQLRGRLLRDEAPLAHCEQQLARIKALQRELIYKVNPNRRNVATGHRGYTGAVRAEDLLLWTDTPALNAALEVSSKSLPEPLDAWPHFSKSWVLRYEPPLSVLGCVQPASLHRYHDVFGPGNLIFFLLEQAISDLGPGSFERGASGSAAWNDLLENILRARGERSFQEFKLPPHLHEMLQAGAETILASLAPPRFRDPISTIREACYNMVLTLQLIENRTAKEVSPSTAENAVVLTNWLMHESERVLGMLQDKEQSTVEHTV